MSDFLTKRTIKLTYDFEAYDNSGVLNSTVAAHPQGVFIPDNAIITGAVWEVITAFTSGGGDVATIAIMAEGAGDILAATTVNATTMATGIHGTLVGYPNLGADAAHDSQVEVAALFAATFIKVAGVEDITFTVGNAQALTAGVGHLYLTYVIGD